MHDFTASDSYTVRLNHIPNKNNSKYFHYSFSGLNYTSYWGLIYFIRDCVADRRGHAVLRASVVKGI